MNVLSMKNRYRILGNFLSSFIIILFGLVGWGLQAATVLSPGDIFVITANSTNPDAIDFVSRVDIDTGTVLYVSDDGITSAGLWRGTEGYITITFTTHVTKGTVIRIDSLNATPTISPGIGTISRTGPFDLSTTSENIFLYQGLTYNTSSSFLYGLGFGGTVWINSGTPTSTNSYLPIPLSLGTSAIEITSPSDNIQYNCTNVSLSSSSFISAINNSNNRNTSNTRYGLSPCVFVFDTIPPSITLSGDISIDLESGNPRIDPGATWTDNVDGSGTILTATSGTVDTNILGVYVLEYTHTDTSGNEGNTITRTVKVIDTTPPTEPIIAININDPYDINNPEINVSGSTDLHFSGYVISIDGSPLINTPYPYYPILSGNTHIVVVRAYDTSDNYHEKTLYYPPVVNIFAPTILSNTGITNTIIEITSSPGDTITSIVFSGVGMGFNCGIVPTLAPITCTGGMIGSSGILEVFASNGLFTGSNTQSYIIDTEDPVITLVGSIHQTIEGGTVWTDPGYSCSDNIDITCSVVVSGTVDYMTVGTYIIEYTAHDTAGNVSSIERTVVVKDTIPPIILLSGSSSMTINQGNVFHDPGARWTDIIDGSGVIPIATSGTVNIHTPGTYILEYTYKDIAGNEGNIVTRTVIVEVSSSGTGGVITGSNSGGGYVIPGEGEIKEETPIKGEGVSIPLSIDMFNPTIYPSTCFVPSYTTTLDQGNIISEAFKTAHQMLYNYELTRRRGTVDYRPYSYLTREEAARFMVEFAKNVLCRKETRRYANNFSDLDTSNPTLTKFIREAYSYGIFNGHTDGTFRPTERITNDELTAVLVRLVTNSILEEPTEDWALNYRNILGKYAKVSALNNQGRGNIAEVIYDLYKNNDYELHDVGYVMK